MYNISKFIYYILLLSIIFLVFYLSNKILIQKENFINIYEILNESLKKKIKENDKDFTIHKKFNNFHDIYLKNIFMTYKKKNKNFSFYLFNYEHKFFMKTEINNNFNNFDIFDENNNKVGFLINKHHNVYNLNLKKLNNYEYKFLIQNNYNQIKIFNELQYDIYYLKKYQNNKNKLIMCIFDEEIGYINHDKQSFKFYIKDKYLNKVNLFCYALMIIVTNNQI